MGEQTGVRQRRFLHPQKGTTMFTRTTCRRGGTIANVITAVIFFGLIAFGILWVMKQAGQATQQYGQAMIDTSDQASALKCQMNMRSIYQGIQVYATVNGTFPASQRELVEAAGSEKLFRCNEPNAPAYVYVPGQRPDASQTAVLVYEPEPIHEGKHTVLFANGEIALLTPEELQLALDATNALAR